MGLPVPKTISKEQQRRSYITVIRRNWHLLPYEQILKLLDWTPGHMAYMLREDDFLFIKLGSHKPKCLPLRYSRPSESASRRAREIAAILRSDMPDAFTTAPEPLFSFVSDLSGPPNSDRPQARDQVTSPPSKAAPRFCYSYFALYGDPLLEPGLEPYPDGYLQRLASLGVNGVWLQAVLQKLAPFPWVSESPAETANREKRLENLRALAERASRKGIGIYLYLNEPRTMPQSFFAKHSELKGAPAGEYASLCTSHPQVQQWLTDSIAHILSAVPKIAGLFTISASENHTNCWSHGAGSHCPRCSKRSPAEVIAEVNTLLHNGIQKAGSDADLLVWDWGWRDDWAEEIVQNLPQRATLMSVSEWSIPIKRGGIDSIVGEYSISEVGPGPRATRHWALARKRGMRTIAKIQAGNTWELSAVPYIPAVENVARHAVRLRHAGVAGLMLGWTLGGYPSPNLEIACAISGDEGKGGMTSEEAVEQALQRVARGRFGDALAAPVVGAWKACSSAFGEFPYHIGVVYNAPMQFGPSNLLWAKRTGYRSTMVGFPYDDLDSWRQVYPAEVFIGQLAKVADGFDAAIAKLRRESEGLKLEPAYEKALELDLNIVTAAAIHFRSSANQARFVHLRDQLGSVSDPKPVREQMRLVLETELNLAQQLYRIQARDSRIGFEATNHYFYVPQDLLEKIVNCRTLLSELDI